METDKGKMFYSILLGFSASKMKKQLALNAQGKTLERKEEEGNTQNRLHRVVLQPPFHCVVLQPPLHKLIFLHMLLSHPSSASTKKIRIQPEREMTNETLEEIPEISSGYVIFDINIFINFAKFNY